VDDDFKPEKPAAGGVFNLIGSSNELRFKKYYESKNAIVDLDNMLTWA